VLELIPKLSAIKVPLMVLCLCTRHYTEGHSGCLQEEPTVPASLKDDCFQTYFFFQYWGSNRGLSEGAVVLESSVSSPLSPFLFCLHFDFKVELANFAQTSLELNSSCFCFPSSWDFRHELPCLSLADFFIDGGSQSLFY
jgi:hypothetical protein